MSLNKRAKLILPNLLVDWSNLTVIGSTYLSPPWHFIWIKLYQGSPFYGGWIVPFRLFAAKRRHAKRRQDEKTPCEKTKKSHAKRRNNAMRKDETRHAKRRNFSAKRQKTPCEKTPFETLNLWSFRVASFRMAFFFSSFRAEISWRVSPFRLGASQLTQNVTRASLECQDVLITLCVCRNGAFSSFYLSVWRFFVFSRSVFSPRKDEIAQSSHHTFHSDAERWNCMCKDAESLA